MALLDGAYGAYVVPKKLGGGGVKTYSCLKVAICPATNSPKSIHIQLFLILCLVQKSSDPSDKDSLGAKFGFQQVSSLTVHQLQCKTCAVFSNAFNMRSPFRRQKNGGGLRFKQDCSNHNVQNAMSCAVVFSLSTQRFSDLF